MSRPNKLGGTTACAVRRAKRPVQSRRAFSIIDLLVSICVVALLIGLLAPSLRSVRETARRVVCSSNIRQMGIGVVLYAEANRDQIPPTAFIENGQPSRLAEMVRL